MGRHSSHQDRLQAQHIGGQFFIAISVLMLMFSLAGWIVARLILISIFVAKLIWRILK